MPDSVSHVCHGWAECRVGIYISAGDEKMSWLSSPASTFSLKGLATFTEDSSKISQKD